MSEATLACPKCGGAWKTVRRDGVAIERCAGCQGVFLDRGELDRLIDAESDYLAALPTEVIPNSEYQGRHRGGVVAQILGAETRDA